jgi:GTP-binding protein Era
MTTQSPAFRMARVAILGRPNAGKSTLLNALLEIAVSATSGRPQTTRTNVRGILQLHDEKTKKWNGQIVLVDTPGVNFKKGLLDRSMHISLEEALDGLNVAIWVADARSFEKDLRDLELGRPGDDKIAGWLDVALGRKDSGKTPAPGVKWILALSKVDQIDKPTLLPLMERIAKLVPEFSEIVPISAVKGLKNPASNLDTLLGLIRAQAPEGEPAYPEEAWTDLSERKLLQNLVRESVFRMSRDEVPYETDCSVYQFVEPDGEKKKRPEADVVIWVARKALKPIMVGARGSRIRDIGIAVRERYQDITGDDLILRLFVKVVDNWAHKPQLLSELGYSVEA